MVKDHFSNNLLKTYLKSNPIGLYDLNRKESFYTTRASMIFFAMKKAFILNIDEPIHIKTIKLKGYLK